ncbi:hypothetical protein ACQ5SK_26680 [Bradyrhizobium japonicum]
MEIGNGLTGLQLDLIDPVSDSASLIKLKAGLNWMSRDLTDRGGCISLQVDTPPFHRWPGRFRSKVNRLRRSGCATIRLLCPARI